MELFYKQWLKDIKHIPDDAYVFGNNMLDFFNTYKYDYCGEVNIINTIKENSNNYFDFSKNMIDIGCEYGEYSFLLPFNCSYMFDGNKLKCVVSEFNMLLHHKENNYICFNELLSDKNEFIKYNGWNSNDISDINYLDINKINIDENNYYNKETKTLDNYSFNNIGFIKVDVEGMEEKVLRGGIGTIIRNNYPPILFECWDVGQYGMTLEKHYSLQTFLEDLGYEILWNWNNDVNTHLAIHKNKI